MIELRPQHTVFRTKSQSGIFEKIPLHQELCPLSHEILLVTLGKIEEFIRLLDELGRG